MNILESLSVTSFDIALCMPDATSDDHCRGGLSLDKRSCPLGCTFGFASADKVTAKLCRKNICEYITICTDYVCIPFVHFCEYHTSSKIKKILSKPDKFKVDKFKCWMSSSIHYGKAKSVQTG